MRLDLNWLQRAILLFAALLLGTATFGSFTSGWDSDPWLTTALFILTVAALLLAASRRANRDN
jgi:hypothetical protein